MALTQEEKQIAEFGAKNGKSKEEISNAISKYRLSSTPASKTNISAPVQKKTSLYEKALNAGTAVTNFLGGKAVADTFGAEIAKRSTDSQAEKDIISAEQPGTLQTLGSGLELGSTFLPGAGAGATLARKAVLGAGTGYAIDVGSGLQNGEGVVEALKPGTATAVGGVLPIVSRAAAKTAGATARGLGKGTAAITGITTGAKGPVVQEAFEAAREGGSRLDSFNKGFTGQVDERQIVGKFNEAFDNVLRQKGAQYQQDFSNLINQGGRKKLATGGVTSALKEGLKTVGVDLGSETPFIRSKIGRNGQAEVQRLVDEVDDFMALGDSVDLEAADALRARLSEFMSRPEKQSKQLDIVAGKLRDSIANTIEKAYPGYKAMNTRYAESTALAKEMQNAFSLGNPEKTETALRKIIQLGKDDRGIKEELANILSQSGQGEDLFSILSGQKLNSLVPRGLAQSVAGGLVGGGAGVATFLLAPQAIPALALASPKIVGQLAKTLGVAARQADGIVKFYEALNQIGFARSLRQAGTIQAGQELVE